MYIVSTLFCSKLVSTESYPKSPPPPPPPSSTINKPLVQWHQFYSIPTSTLTLFLFHLTLKVIVVPPFSQIHFQPSPFGYFMHTYITTTYITELEVSERWH